mgnify:CR=1 FL=1
MIVVLKDSLTGNIVGIISLIIGIISLIITVKTMRSARRIERDIKEAEVKAIDKDRFNKYKESCIKKLELKRKVVADEGVILYAMMYWQILMICGDMIELYQKKIWIVLMRSVKN